MNTADKLNLALIKTSAELNEKQIDRLTAMPSLASSLLSLPSSARSAGRARAMQEASGSGEDIPLSVNYPTLSKFLAGGAGSLLGGMAGGAIGSGFQRSDGYGHTYDRSGEGVMGGSLLGGILGVAINNIIQRKRTKEIFDSKAGKNMNPDLLHPGSRIAAPVSGVHQMGRADVKGALSTGQDEFGSNPRLTLSRLLEFVPLLGPTIAAPASMLGNTAEYGRSRAAFER